MVEEGSTGASGTGMGWFNSYTPPHFGRGKRRGRRPPEAEGARRGATPRATHGSLRAYGMVKLIHSSPFRPGEWYGMVPLLPPGPQSMQPGGGSWTGRRLSMLRLSPFRLQAEAWSGGARGRPCSGLRLSGRNTSQHPARRTPAHQCPRPWLAPAHPGDPCPESVSGGCRPPGRA
jgi:hypothetical protein